MHCCATKIHFCDYLTILCTVSLFQQCTEEKTAIPEIPIQKTEKAHIAAPVPEMVPAEIQSCEEKIKAKTPVQRNSLKKYWRALPHIVIDTKTTPVQYLKKPEVTREPIARRISNELSKKTRLAQYLREQIKRYKNDKSMLRRIFLREGYFFDERPRIAHQMVKEIKLTDLFLAPHIFRLRRNRIEKLTLKEGKYIDEDGERAKLFVNDRVSNDDASLYPPLHLDANTIKKETGAQRTILDTIFEDGASIILSFPGGEKRPALVSIKDNKTKIDCIGGEPRTLKATMDRARQFWEDHKKIIESAKKIVAERPRFDEPTDELEDIQEDGELRLEWKKAYRSRKKKFLYREVEYDVFDRRGNPIPPQVCVDFIVDTWERAFGTWYTPKGVSPARTDGRIDMYALEGVSRRYISSILDHALQDGSPFLRYDIPKRDWVPLEERWKYVKKLAKYTKHFQEGDLLVIHGIREEDMEEHYHTVLVLETDPITGLPTLVADNQGRPRISNLVQAMRAAPKRSIKHRIRLNFEKLAELTETYRKNKEYESQ